MTPKVSPKVRRRLKELDDIAEALAPVDGLYSRRAEIYVELREQDPPVPFRVIAEHARSTEDAVIQATKKAKRLRDEA